MIVYVETNWILDIVLKQEKHKESIQVLNASKKGEIILVLPMVCIGEAYNNMSRRKEEMVRTLEACRPVLNRVKRSQTPEHIRQRDFLLGVVEELAGLWAKEEDALEDILKDVLSVAELIPLSNEVFLKSFSVRKRYEMGRMDTLIYASVWEHAKAHCQESKVFLNYDKHFNQPGLKRHLQRLNTKLFSDAKNLFMYMKRPRKGVQQ